jgi:hypothetical protein
MLRQPKFVKTVHKLWYASRVNLHIALKRNVYQRASAYFLNNRFYTIGNTDNSTDSDCLPLRQKSV